MSDTEDFRPEARKARGLADRRGADLAAERRIVAAVSGIYERWGFEALETPAFEHADALGKFLPDADRPNEGVFAFQDDDEQWLALRYDLTAPLARFAAEHWQTLPKPYRRYAFGPVWRNEKPGPGRFREFIQCDADTVGSDRPEADAEIIAMAVEGLAAAGVPDGGAVIKINTRKLLNGLLDRNSVTSGQTLGVLRAIDKLDRLGPDGVTLLLGEGRLDESGDFTKGAGLTASQTSAVLAFLSSGQGSRAETLSALSDVVGGSAEGDQGLEELARIDAALRAMGVADDKALLDPSIVRGLEYYTGAVFEAELLLKGPVETMRLGSIGGGGRYDDLVARFTGERAPATGFSFGVSRLAYALGVMGAAQAEPRGPVVIVAFDEAAMADYFAVAAELRTAGIPAEVYLGRSGLKAQMKYADRRNSPAAILIGEDEIKAGQVTIKDLDLGRKLAAGADQQSWKTERPGQQTVARDQMIATVKAIVADAN